MSTMPPLSEDRTTNNGRDYYAAGSSEIAEETKLTLTRLEPVSFRRLMPMKFCV